MWVFGPKGQGRSEIKLCELPRTGNAALQGIQCVLPALFRLLHLLPRPLLSQGVGAAKACYVSLRPGNSGCESACWNAKLLGGFEAHPEPICDML